MNTKTVEIRGMNCEHCVMAVRRELGRVPGLTVHDVRLGSAVVSYDPLAVSFAAIEGAVTDAGYTVVREPRHDMH